MCVPYVCFPPPPRKPHIKPNPLVLSAALRKEGSPPWDGIIVGRVPPLSPLPPMHFSPYGVLALTM